ncbi:MAG: DUF4292 domain-containing protein [Chitinophagaceae bacterium]|nr:DUF4292 domain-containing protein [Chitinophagaceae bacterium]
MNKCIYIVASFMILLTSSCQWVQPFFIKNEKKEERKEKRIERKIVRGNLITVPSDSSAYKSAMADVQIARNWIAATDIPYERFQCKAKMNLESNGKKQSFNANFRLLNNKVIWVSIHAPIVGEVARAIITPVSVKAMERINKRSYLYSYNGLQKLINLEVDFKTLQNLIIGQSVATDGQITDVKRMGNTMRIDIKGNSGNNQININPADTTLQQLHVQTNRGESASSILIQFERYEPQQNTRVSTLRNYHVQDAKGVVELNMEINKFDINPDIDFPYTVPSNYRPQK